VKYNLSVTFCSVSVTVYIPRLAVPTTFSVLIEDPVWNVNEQQVGSFVFHFIPDFVIRLHFVYQCTLS